MHFSTVQIAGRGDIVRRHTKLKATAIPDVHLNCKYIFLNYAKLSS